MCVVIAILSLHHLFFVSIFSNIFLIRFSSMTLVQLRHFSFHSGGILSLRLWYKHVCAPLYLNQVFIGHLTREDISFPSPSYLSQSKKMGGNVEEYHSREKTCAEWQRGGDTVSAPFKSLQLLPSFSFQPLCPFCIYHLLRQTSVALIKAETDEIRKGSIS